MILEKGEKIHVITRRFFEGDLRWHFIGEIIEVSGALARVEGYVFVFDAGKNQYVQRPDKRSRILGLADSGLIINVLPENADLERTRYAHSQKNILVVTDGTTFTLDINEFSSTQ